MGNWKSLNPNQFVPSVVATGLQDGVSWANQRLAEAQTQLALVQAKTAAGISSVDALSLLITALANTLQSLLQVGKLHALYIPIAKTFPGKTSPLVPPTLDGLENAYGSNLALAGAALTAGASTSYASLVARTGGNASFYNAFVSSLADE